MKNVKRYTTGVLSLYPNINGFSFSYFEGPQELIDWGTCCTKPEKIATRLQELIIRYKPEVIITDDHLGSGYKRGKRNTEALKEIYRLAQENEVLLKKYSQSLIKGVFDCFAVHNKYERTKLLASWFPDFALKLPTKPKIWSREHYRMGVFDAISYAFVYFYTEAI